MAVRTPPSRWTGVSGVGLTLVSAFLNKLPEWQQGLVLALGLMLIVVGFGRDLVRFFESWRWRREAPGFAAHFVTRIHTGELDRRQYLFDCRDAESAGAALYLSASGKPTFSVTDKMGEIYPVETSTGFEGVPFGHWIYLAAEAALWPSQTILRIKVNGDVVAERFVPFKLDLGGLDWKPTLGAAAGGRSHGKFDLGEIIVRDKTLGILDSRRLLGYFRKKWNIHD